MTRIMYDGITPTSVPGGARIYAGYVNGEWPSYAELAARNPLALHVSIAVNVSARAKCLDVENGDATPAQAPGWVLQQRAAGDPYPWVYMNEETWPAVRAAFAAQKVAPPWYWVAGYVKDPSKYGAIPAGAIGIQDYDFGGYDRSVMADYIPGLDPVPVTAAGAAPEEDEDMSTTSVNGRAGLSWPAGTRHVVQATCDPGAAQDKPFTLRGVLVFPKTPATPGPVVFSLTVDSGGTGNYEIPLNLRGTCRGVILEGAATPVYDVTAV